MYSEPAPACYQEVGLSSLSQEQIASYGSKFVGSGQGGAATMSAPPTMSQVATYEGGQGELQSNGIDRVRNTKSSHFFA